MKSLALAALTLIILGPLSAQALICESLTKDAAGTPASLDLKDMGSGQYVGANSIYAVDVQVTGDSISAQIWDLTRKVHETVPGQIGKDNYGFAIMQTPNGPRPDPDGMSVPYIMIRCEK